MSRPNRAEARSTPLQVRLSPAERRSVDRAATANHQTTSDFARDALVTAAAECLEPLAQGFRTTKLRTERKLDVM
jgi:uncharacterized protein (DUF1778 family)